MSGSRGANVVDVWCGTLDLVGWYSLAPAPSPNVFGRPDSVWIPGRGHPESELNAMVRLPILTNSCRVSLLLSVYVPSLDAFEQASDQLARLQKHPTCIVLSLRFLDRILKLLCRTHMAVSREAGAANNPKAF